MYFILVQFMTISFICISKVKMSNVFYSKCYRYIIYLLIHFDVVSNNELKAEWWHILFI